MQQSPTNVSDFSITNEVEQISLFMLCSIQDSWHSLLASYFVYALLFFLKLFLIFRQFSVAGAVKSICLSPFLKKQLEVKIVEVVFKSHNISHPFFSAFKDRVQPYKDFPLLKNKFILTQYMSKEIFF